MFLGECEHIMSDEEIKPDENFVPFEAYRQAIFDVENDTFWDSEQSIGQNLIDLINGVVWLPDAHIQVPIAASYILIPSALSSACYVLFLYGQQGSGKSDFSHIVEKLHDSSLQGYNTTYVGLRNYIQEKRWRIPNVQELNFCLLFNNLPHDIWQTRPELYNFFLVGCRRGEDEIRISKGQGENLVFKVFGTKVINSKFPVFMSTEKFDASELKDRVLIVWFQRNTEFTKLVNVATNDLSFLKSELDSFWSKPENLHLFINTKKQALKEWKKLLSGNRKWLLAVDLLVTSVVTGIFPNLSAAQQTFADFLKYQDERVTGIVNPVKFVLQQYVNQRIHEITEINQEFSKIGKAIPYEISPEQLKTQLEIAKAHGLINQFDSKYVALTMEDLGFMLQKSELSSKLVWVKR